MQITKLIFIPAVLMMVGLTSSITTAQNYVVQPSTPVYQQPIYYQTPPAGGQIGNGSSWDSSTCQCPPSGNGPCDCKNLNCKIKLPHGCKSSTPPYKRPIPCTIYGKIPVINYNNDCLAKHCDFRYVTEVPEVHCVCEQCVEIGQKFIQCLPGCCFTVCVPKSQCTSKTVQCKLGQKNMPMELWKRTENGQTVYDVYVINNPSCESPDQAGGMPAKWVIMHCGTPQQFAARFPGAVCVDGNPILGANSANENAKPASTTADVKLEMIVDKEQLTSYVEQQSEAEDAEVAADLLVTATTDADKS